MSESDKILKLEAAALMALGWMSACATANDPVIIFLARTLRQCGTENDFVDEIVANANRQGL